MIDYSRYLVQPNSSFSLAARVTKDTQGVDEEEARKKVKKNRKKIVKLQERLFAEREQSLLIVLQAMDTAGKDSTIREVTKGINPQGCRVASFKAPTKRELEQDFLWRVHFHTPRKGYIGIFNRSHYEDVLIVKVHGWADPDVIEERYAHINNFEKLLAERGTRIIKIMLHVSKEYQLFRLRRRLERPDKHWKFNPGDLKEREHWNSYMAAYEVALGRCSTDFAPWYVIPAEERWFRDLVITQLIVDTLEDMDPQFPEPDFDPADYPPESLV